MTPRARTRGQGHHLTWRRGDLAVLIVLALAAGALLAWRGAERRGALETLRRAAGPHADHAVERIDPNTASAHSLRRLPRIGPALAEAIVTARQSGPFKDVADLQRRVRGIGPVTAEIIAPHLTFDRDGK